MHRLDLTGVDAGELVRGLDPAEELPAHPGRRHGVPLARSHHQALVVGGPLPFALVQEPEVLREGLGVHGGLDLEHLRALGGDQAAHPRRGVGDRAVSRPRVHVGTRVHHRLDVVMVLEGAIASQTDRDRLVAAVHRHEVHVDVDEQVRLGGALRDLDDLVLVGGADLRQLVLVLAIEVVEVLRPEGPIDALAHHPADLACGHPPVERGGDDDLDVLDALASRELDHLLEDALPDVGERHRRQGDRDVVHGDRELHPGLQQLRERLGVPERMQQRMTDRGVHVPDPRQRVRGVHHAGAERELLHAEALPFVHEQRGRPLVHLQHETGSGHVSSSPVFSFS